MPETLKSKKKTHPWYKMQENQRERDGDESVYQIKNNPSGKKLKGMRASTSTTIKSLIHLAGIVVNGIMQNSVQLKTKFAIFVEKGHKESCCRAKTNQRTRNAKILKVNAEKRRSYVDMKINHHQHHPFNFFS